MMFGLNPFELAMILVFTVLAIAAARSFVETPPILGPKRLLIYGLVLLVWTAALLGVIEGKTGMISAR